MREKAKYEKWVEKLNFMLPISLKKCNFKNWEAIQESDVKFFAISMHLWYFHISTALETRLKTEL